MESTGGKGRSATRLIVLAAFAGVLAACGGGSSESGAPAPPPGPAAPGFTTQPEDQNIVAPAAAGFSVAASGDDVTYQWQWSIDGSATWSDIAGATNATYALPSTHAGMNGLGLRALARNATGVATSAAANLGIRTAGAPGGTLQVLAGGIGGAGNIDGAGTSARLLHPSTLTIDAEGTIHVCVADDQFSAAVPNTERRISAQGFATTIVVPPSGLGLCNVENAFDAAGNSYFATDGLTIRKRSAAGVVSKFADVPGMYGRLALDAAGNVYMAETDQHAIRKITAAGVVSTLAGMPGSSGSADGSGDAARFFRPFALVVDRAGNVFVSDQWNHTIRKITSASVVTTLAGVAGQWGDADGTGAAARFAAPSGIVLDRSDNLYVADRDNFLIRKITPAGVVTTLAGRGGELRPATPSQFQGVTSLAIDGGGTVLVADPNHHAIRKVAPDGTMPVWVGAPPSPGSADGSGAAAGFRNPTGVAAAADGNVYVADSGNHTIRQITRLGAVSTVAGFAQNPGTTDAVGPVARFKDPSDIAVDATGNLQVTDTGNESVRMVTPAGQVTTRLSGKAGATGIAMAAGGGLYLGLSTELRPSIPFAFSIPHSRFERIEPSGTGSVLAGAQPPSVQSISYRDGAGGQALFSRSGAIAAAASGTLYVADTGNCLIRRIDSAGFVSALAGRPPDANTGDDCGSTDGVGTAARLQRPQGLALDGSGNLYVADYNTIRKITPDGTVTTVLGSAERLGIAVVGTPSLAPTKRIAWLGGNRFAITSGDAVLIATLP
jgi:sugar lactone lactonase YvrE